MLHKQSRAEKCILFILMVLVSICMLLPLAWMISASLKLDSQVFTVPVQWIPENPQWQNYLLIWTRIDLALYTFNTVKITVVVTLLQLFTSSLAAYGFAKCRFRGRNSLFFFYVITIAIPWQVYMLPQYIMMAKAGLVDTHLAIILLHSFTAFGVFLLRQFYMSVPDELLEAARIDGLTEHGIYLRIMLPLSKPAIATLCIFSFVTTWNDFLGPMIYFNSNDLKTIQIGIRMFISLYSSEYNLIMAASVLSLIPVLTIFLAFQKFFVQGVATSGLKG
ncbi:MAG: carbohydrate ABC transporter permease [Faecalibacterium sp.]